MRIGNAASPFEAYEKLKKANDKLNCIVTAIEPHEEGIPIALKDNVCTRSILTTASCRILDNYIPVYDATIIGRLKAKGFVPVAKTSMDELAMGGTNLTALTGPCHNPYDLERISGGSSGGSAVAVASGLVPVAIGTDTGDSIRKPASYCGVVGVKPSYGKISRYGIIPYASSLDHVGCFTTNVRDAAYMLEVLSGRDDKDMTSSFEEVPSYSRIINSDISGRKLLIFKNVLDEIEDHDVLRAFNDTVTVLRMKGAVIEEVSFDETLMKAVLPVYYLIANGEATANHANLTGIPFGERAQGKDFEEVMINSRSRGFSSSIKQRFVIGSYALYKENQGHYYRKAQKIRRLVVEEVMNRLRDADALIAPTVPGIAPLMKESSTDELDDNLISHSHLIIANFAGLPSLSLPMGFSHGLPLGFSITANPFMEDIMFDIAKAVEEYTGLEGQTKEDF